jgi:hypothetical protein
MEQMLTAVASVYQLPDAYDRCVSFMLSALGLVRSQMTEMAATAFAEAASYWSGQIQDVSLEAQKVILWRHLDGMVRTKANADREEAVLRAVLFVLDLKPATDDIFELLDWFVQFLCGAGAQASDIAALLQEHLPVGDGPDSDRG